MAQWSSINELLEKKRTAETLFFGKTYKLSRLFLRVGSRVKNVARTMLMLLAKRRTVAVTRQQPLVQLSHLDLNRTSGFKEDLSISMTLKQRTTAPAGRIPVLAAPQFICYILPLYYSHRLLFC